MATKKVEQYGELTAEDLTRAASEIKGMEIVLGDKRADVSYKPLTWWQRNRCISAATEYIIEKDAKGQDVLRTRFHQETYYEEALKEMLLTAPFPVTTMGLRNLPVEVGRQLEALVPNPANVEEVAAAKKE